MPAANLKNIKEKRLFESVKKDILDAIKEIEKSCPELAKHLEDNIIMDEEDKTFCYKGNIKWDKGDK